MQSFLRRARGGHTGKDKTVLIDHIGAIRSMVAAQVHGAKRFVMLSALNVAVNSKSKIAHYHRAKAHADGTLVFVNYTGLTCTNCRYMEGGVFPLPRIVSLLKTMTLVELYTDGGTDAHDKNRRDQVARFQTAALPL